MINSWMIDIDSAYHAMMNAKDGTSEFIARGADLTQYYTFGDCDDNSLLNVETSAASIVTATRFSELVAAHD